MTSAFIIIATFTLAGAIAAMTLRRLIHCVLALMVAVSGLAAMYIELGAQFVGLAQILVYIGAVAILLVFAVLLTRSSDLSAEPAALSSRLSSVVIAVAVFAVLAWAMRATAAIRLPSQTHPVINIAAIGNLLMSRFILPLEVIGLMLTAALIGAVIVAMQARPGSR